MKWLQRLKALSTPDADATEPTKPCFVGFVAPPVAPSEKFAAPKAASTNQDSADPDSCCWPHSSAMNTAEIDTFIARVAQFTAKGLSLAEAEALADRLVLRDREGDDRRLCVECVHLKGDTGRWRCASAAVANISWYAGDTALAGALVRQPQRCAAFCNFHGEVAKA